MSDRAALATKIRAARCARDWTVYAMSKRMRNVSHYTVMNLEGRVANRATAGPDVKLRTAVEICTVLWPDVRLEDFYGGEEQLLRFTVRQPDGEEHIERRQAS